MKEHALEKCTRSWHLYFESSYQNINQESRFKREVGVAVVLHDFYSVSDYVFSRSCSNGTMFAVCLVAQVQGHTWRKVGRLHPAPASRPSSSRLVPYHPQFTFTPSPSLLLFTLPSLSKAFFHSGCSDKQNILFSGFVLQCVCRF